MSIRILTWNISFGAMIGSDLDKSSMPLPQVCRKRLITDNKGISVTQCLMNVVETIDKSVISQSYDFIALQEASNWNIILSKSNELQRMGGSVHHLADLEDIATFYDKQKYTLLAVKNGNLVPKNGRPYQILFLQNNKDKSYYIFINLHNGHNISKEDLEKKLSTNLHIGNIPDASGKLNKEDDLSNIINGKDFKVILAGDTNDNGKYNYWNELCPFSKTNFVNLKDLVVKSPIEPPKTCCAPINLPIYNEKKEKIIKYNKVKPIRTSISDDTMFGDYILFSQNLSVSINNRILEGFNYRADLFPTSDHLPVEIVLNSTDIKHDNEVKPMEIHTETPYPVLLNLKKDNDDTTYKEKYLKYKQKYLKLKNTTNV